MKLEHIVKNLEKKGLKYSINLPASVSEIAQAEENLNVEFPAPISIFYQQCNGLSVEEPQLEILPLSQFEYIAPHRLHFATFDGSVKVCFDTSHRNEAGQWFIVCAQNEYRITFTMASFLSNKIWHWLPFKSKIWMPYEQW